MANSGSSSTVSNNPQQLYCYCGYLAKESVAKTDTNYGRRFLGCQMYGTKRKCHFFKWRDEEFPARAMYVIRKLVKDNMRLEVDNMKLNEAVIQHQMEAQKLKEKFDQELGQKREGFVVNSVMIFMLAICMLGFAVLYVVLG